MFTARERAEIVQRIRIPPTDSKPLSLFLPCRTVAPGSLCSRDHPPPPRVHRLAVAETRTPASSALLVLAHLHKGETFAQLLAGFGSEPRRPGGMWTRPSRCSPSAPKLRQAVRAGKAYPYVVLDGTLILTNRVAADRPFLSGKHRRHGMNLQVMANRRQPDLGLLGAARRGSRQQGSLDLRHRARAGRRRPGHPLADKGYRGARHALTPYKGKSKPESRKQANKARAKLRAPGERGNAQLKGWKILRKLRCCPWRAGQITKAILVLQTREATTGGKGSLHEGMCAPGGADSAARRFRQSLPGLLSPASEGEKAACPVTWRRITRSARMKDILSGSKSAWSAASRIRCRIPL